MTIKDKIKNLPVLRTINNKIIEKNNKIENDNAFKIGCEKILEVSRILNENSVSFYFVESPIEEFINNLSIEQKQRIKNWRFNINSISESDIEYLKTVYKEDYSPEYIEAIFSGTKVVDIGGMKQLVDFTSDKVNILNSTRLTLFNPTEYSNKIHIYGACTARGTGVEDKHTIESFLQERINQQGKALLVENNGVGCGSRITDNCLHIKNTPFSEGDVVIMLDNMQKGFDLFCKDNNINYINSACAFDNVEQEWFLDQCQHTNKVGNKILADFIYKNIIEKLPAGNNKRKERYLFESKIIALDGNKDFEEYISKIEKLKPEDADNCVCGSIVMNCNPFTLGHRYLIETACSQVDYLYVFVVEEDKSYFKFEDRLKLVKEGCKDLDNVIVLPSGKFILSAITFPGYFNKGTNNDAIVDTSMDIKLFANHIAPKLNISKRFAGHEPIDMVTKQYNETMKNLLPNYSIEFIEIKRIENCGDVISASRVRKAIKEKDIELIDNLVPPSTSIFIKEKFFNE